MKLKPFIAEATLDFHDRGPLTIYEIEKLTREFIEDSYAADYDTVLLVTGNGRNSPKGPVVRPLVQKLLATLPQVKSCKPTLNEAGFQVWLKN